LIVHGTQDAAFRPAHAYALADEILRAQLVMIEELGHVTGAGIFSTIVPAVISHQGVNPGSMRLVDAGLSAIAENPTTVAYLTGEADVVTGRS
jgi:hypothetical protein